MSCKYSNHFLALEGMTEALNQELDPSWNIHITLVECGAFRTSFVANRVFDIFTHPAYTNPSVNGYQIREAFDKMKPEDLTGDPNKMVKKVWELARLENPPFRILLGKDAWGGVEAKRKRDWEEWEKYRSWSEDLEFDK
jgi:short-subunit dehydrogenase